MAFIIYSNLALEFIALCSGTALLAWAFQKKGNGSALASFIGTFVMFFSFVSIVATLFFGGKAWMAGHFDIIRIPEKNMHMQELDKMEKMIEQMKTHLKEQKASEAAQ